MLTPCRLLFHSWEKKTVDNFHRMLYTGCWLRLRSLDRSGAWQGRSEHHFFIRLEGVLRSTPIGQIILPCMYLPSLPLPRERTDQNNSSVNFWFKKFRQVFNHSRVTSSSLVSSTYSIATLFIKNFSFNLYLTRKGSLRLKSPFQERPGQDRQHQVITKKVQTTWKTTSNLVKNIELTRV